MSQDCWVSQNQERDTAVAKWAQDGVSGAPDSNPLMKLLLHRRATDFISGLFLPLKDKGSLGSLQLSNSWLHDCGNSTGVGRRSCWTFQELPLPFLPPRKREAIQGRNQISGLPALLNAILGWPDQGRKEVWRQKQGPHTRSCGCHSNHHVLDFVLS